MTTSTGPGRGIKKLITDDGASLQLCSAAVSAVPPADCSNARQYEGWSGSGCYCGGAAPRDSRLHDGIAPLLAPRCDTSKGRKYPRTSATFIFLGRDPEHGVTVSCSNCCYLFIVIASCSTSNIKC